MTSSEVDERADPSIQALFSDLVTKHGVVGAGLAIVLDDRVLEFASGHADLRGPRPMTTDTVCLIGSTTKVYTATLLMQLVASGLADLDEPVRTYLPDFTVADVETTETLTLRDLLRHTSGLGIGAYASGRPRDDAVADFVTGLATQPAVHAPGERFGYSNAGYVVAGRVVEVLTGLPWDRALSHHLLGPAGLIHTLTAPEEILLRPVAVPHTVEPGERPSVTSTWGIAGWPLGPTGSTLVSTAGDLARFARLHLRHGSTAEGLHVVPPDAIASMQVPHVSLPDGLPYAATWGLGWFADHWGSTRMVGHAGHNKGAGSHLALFPDVGGALALVFNSVPGDAGLHHELFAQLAAELFNATKPVPWRTPSAEGPTDLTRYAGTYTTDGHQMEVRVDGGQLMVTWSSGVSQHFCSIGGGRFGTGKLDNHHMRPPEGALTPQLVFDGEDDSGRATHAYSSVFVMRRIGSR